MKRVNDIRDERFLKFLCVFWFFICLFLQIFFLQEPFSKMSSWQRASLTWQGNDITCLHPCGSRKLTMPRSDLSWLDIIRIPPVICGRSSSHVFFSKRARNLSGCQKSARTTEISILLYCEITATISSEVPSPGKRRHHIFLFEELSPQISSFDMIFEFTSHFFNCHIWMFLFW